MLCVVPALRSLRRALPKARVTLVGLSSAREFVRRFSPYIDELAESPGYPGIPEAELCPEKLPGFLKEMHDHHFDLAVQMHGSGVVTNPFTLLLGARFNAGFCIAGQFCPDADRFLQYRDNEPEVLRYVRLMEFLGIPPAGACLEFPLWKEDRQELARMPEIRNLWPRGYICIHPGAGDPSRCWPAGRFAAVADKLFDPALPVVFTGNAAESALTRKIATSMQHAPIDLAGRLGLGALGVLLSNARLLICNDTGISHMAAALQVPSVVIFTNSDPDRWAPLDSSLHRIVVGAAANGETGDIGTMRKQLPEVNDVLSAAEDLLREEKLHWQSQ